MASDSDFLDFNFDSFWVDRYQTCLMLWVDFRTYCLCASLCFEQLCNHLLSWQIYDVYCLKSVPILKVVWCIPAFISIWKKVYSSNFCHSAGPGPWWWRGWGFQNGRPCRSHVAGLKWHPQRSLQHRALQHGGHVDYHGIAIGGQGSYIGSGDAGSRYHHTCVETEQTQLNHHKLKHKSHFNAMQLLVMYLEAVLTLTSRSPLKTNCPGFQSKFSLLHSQCRFSVVL